MKQLLIASALTLTLAAIPAFATTTFNVSPAGSSSLVGDPDDSHSWSISAPGESNEVVISNLGHDDIEVFVKVNSSADGSDSANVECNGYNNTVKPGNFFLCKTRYNVEIEDIGGTYGASGYFTVKY